MSDKLARMIAFTAASYNKANGREPGLALGFAAIMIQTREYRLSSEQPAEDMLDWLSRPHADPATVKACKQVLEYLGS